MIELEASQTVFLLKRAAPTHEAFSSPLGVRYWAAQVKAFCPAYILVEILRRDLNKSPEARSSRRCFDN